MKKAPPTQSEFIKMVTPAMIKAASAVLMAMAWVETVRPKVEKYSNEILAKHRFTNRGKVERLKNRFKDIEEKVILTRKEAYHLSDEDFAIYHEECKAARDKAGLKVDNPDHCPLLVAEHLLSKAETAFIDAMEPITGISSDASGLWVQDNRSKLIDLNLRVLVSAGLVTTSSVIKK